MTRTSRSCLKLSMMVIVVTAFTACTKSEMAEPTSHAPISHYEVKAPPPPSGPPHHWIEDDRLQEVMKKLGTTSASQWPDSLPDDPEVVVTKEDRDRAFSNAAGLASSLADSALRIPGAVAALNMTDVDRKEFARIANELGDQARLLGTAAGRRNVEDMQQRLDAIRASCISCHTRFKDISGDLPPRA